MSPQTEGLDSSLLDTGSNSGGACVVFVVVDVTRMTGYPISSPLSCGEVCSFQPATRRLRSIVNVYSFGLNNNISLSRSIHTYIYTDVRDAVTSSSHAHKDQCVFSGGYCADVSDNFQSNSLEVVTCVIALVANSCLKVNNSVRSVTGGIYIELKS